MERLCRYGARGALVLERLSRAEDGRIAWRMKRPLPDGTTHLLFTGLELLRCAGRSCTHTVGANSDVVCTSGSCNTTCEGSCTVSGTANLTCKTGTKGLAGCN